MIAERVPALPSIAEDVYRGLTRIPKALPPKLFYDAAGSALFEQITRLLNSLEAGGRSILVPNDQDLLQSIVDAAAQIFGAAAASIALVDESPWLGGQIWRGQEGRSASRKAQRWFERFRHCGARLLDRTAVVAMPTAGLLLAERDGEPRQIKWQRLILATGARELFLPFPGWTLPGVMGAGGLGSAEATVIAG